VGQLITFYTVGYAKKDIETFISELEMNDVDLLVDVRDYPHSRKKGFSKSSLSEALKQQGINYQHYPELGSPKELRKKFYEDGDFDEFRRNFQATFALRHDTLLDLLGLAATRNICLMCFEADWQGCHRSILAEEIVSLDGKETNVVHL
jgi:uncharacterized protein (DUF488 family)